MTTRPLNPRQEAFAREYLVDLDAANAARRAGYSSRTARQTGYDLLQDERIQAMVRAEMAARAERVEDSADQVLQDLRRLGQKAEKLGEFSAALKAVELRGKHLGMFKERIALGGDPDSPPVETVTRVELVALQPT